MVRGGDAHLAEDAIRHIGTDAVPHLLVWIEYEPPAWRRKLYNTALLNNIADWRNSEDDQLLLGMGTPSAFGALGAAAKGAIPKLSQLMNDPKRDEAATFAARALADIGTEALPALLGGLTNQRLAVRRLCSKGIGTMATNSPSAIPILKRLLADPDAYVRSEASNALGKIDPHVMERPAP